jgi:Ni,Fe-hydrogenase III small subunit/Pyruvate/2-oxoacid:ferredoxin oxidoreductase delta subunit
MLTEIKNIFSKHTSLNFDVLSPLSKNARGIPVPSKVMALQGCRNCKSCEDHCPTKAIQVESESTFHIDYGACLQCGICVNICPNDKLENSNFVYAFALNRDELKITYNKGDFIPKEFPITEDVKKFQKLTKNRGFNYREVAAGGNNSVECELNASFNNVFDSEGWQIRSVASPKHADAIVYSGPVSENMTKPLQIAWDTMPEPKALIANGTEAIMGGLFTEGKKPKTPDLFIAGDPPRPDVMIQAFRYLMGKFQFSFQKALKEFLNNNKNR